jgi:hypothetical protein
MGRKRRHRQGHRKGPRPVLFPIPPLPPLPPPPRPRWIIPAAVTATLHGVEVIAAWMLPGKGTRYIGIDIYMVIIGLGFSAIATAMLVTGRADTPMSFGDMSRERSPIAYWYNVLGFGLLGHAVFCFGVSRLTHPLAS